ncbi:hypothetical protein AX755_03555 [Enterobacter sp. SENG-6]|nr:hypothetical protein AX755_03555 [Enterobacter sp. SENG-6]
MVRFEPDAMFNTRYHVAPDGVVIVLNSYNALFCNFFMGNARVFEHDIFERKLNPTMLTDTKLRNLKPKDKL